jgi:hypothetical protein
VGFLFSEPAKLASASLENKKAYGEAARVLIKVCSLPPKGIMK